MTYPKEFSVVLYILLIGLCAYLLCVGKISGRAFVFSLFLSAASVALMHNLDVVQRLSVKGQGVEATAEFQRIRDEVYAKESAVQQMTEAVAGLIAESVTTSSRFGGSGDPDPIAQKGRYRDKIRQTLIDAKTPKDRIDQILAPFAYWIPLDLRIDIQTSASQLIGMKGMTPQQRNEFGSKLDSALDTKPPIAGLNAAEKFIHDEGLSSPELEENIKRYRTYLTTGEVLPSMFPRK
jgi:hypothetical protein